MAKELTFELLGEKFSLIPNKLERKKLYGWSEILALDENSEECNLVSVDESGTIIITKGNVGMGIVSEDMKWIDRSELIATDNEGNTLNKFESTFNKVVELNEFVSTEEFLDYSITAVYQLDTENDISSLIKELKNKIYKFYFNYRDGYDEKPAFLIQSEGKVFILIGLLNELTFIGYEEVGYIDNEEESTEQDELDFDFSMM